jgi:hypothetical protein
LARNVHFISGLIESGVDFVAADNRKLAPLLAELKSAGLSVRQMASELTARGILTPTGARWHAQTVIRVLDRAEQRTVGDTGFAPPP